MRLFELSKEATADLRKIGIHTEKRWWRIQRYHYIKQFDDVFHLLSEN